MHWLTLMDEPEAIVIEQPRWRNEIVSSCHLMAARVLTAKFRALNWFRWHMFCHTVARTLDL